MQHNRKLLATFLLSAVALCAFVFGGCHRHIHETRYIQATCTQAGFYEDFCPNCGYIHESYQTSPALGHNYDGGYCENCGEPDPNDSSLSNDTQSKVKLSADGTLSWTKLKNATKYELIITTTGSDEPTVYTFPKKQGSAKLDDLGGNDDYGNKVYFPTGRTFAQFVHYEIYTETVEGEKIEQEVPMTEQADEFRVLKRNGVFELERLGYSDENLTLSGFYSEAREGESGEYYLYEVPLNEKNENVKVNLPKQVKLAAGNRAAYYRTAEDRTGNQNAISSFDWNYMNFPAGATTIYMRLTLAGGGYKDYNLCVYGLRNLEITRYSVSSLNSRQEVGTKFTCLEGDIISSEDVCRGLRLDTYYLRDSDYNYLGKVECNYFESTFSGADYTVTYSGSGNGVELYFYTTDIKPLCDEVKEASNTYLVREVWSNNDLRGYDLVYKTSSTATEAVIPTDIYGKNILSADFEYAQVNTITIGDVHTLPKLTLNINVTTINLGDIHSISAGAFVGANSNLVINCAFNEEQAQYFETKWNYKEPLNQYSTAKFTTNYNVQ